MAVEAENLVEQLGAEPVHHRHHDDEGGDPEHDAQKREAGDDRDESFLAPGPQVAQRQHPFERRKGAGSGRLSHAILPRADSHMILAVSRHFSTAAKAFTHTREDSCRTHGRWGLMYAHKLV